MAGLTVTEKEHWKDRIARRIEKRIEAITAGDSGFFGRVEQQAHQRALESLGVADQQAELEAIGQEQQALARREEHVRRSMIATVRGVAVEDITDACSYRYNQEVERAVEKRKAVHEDELLAESELGQQVLRLRSEKEELLDVVWLATSPKQIKELWAKVADLLDDEQTQLQKDALNIPPLDE